MSDQEEKKCNCKVFAGLVLLSLLLSVASLTLQIMGMTGNLPGAGPEGKKVVISKQYDKGKSLDKARATGKPVIVFFYTDWCGFCQRFVPTYHKMSKDKKIKQNFAVAYVNCENPENAKLMEEFNVKGFPTVFVVSADGTSRTQLDNATFFNPDSKDVITNKALELIGQNK